MRRSIICLTFLLLCASYASSQTARPSSTPPAADETDVVKITTALIQLDVSVTDKKGKIVTDIRPDEVEVYENGEKQKITNFSFISNIRSAEPSPAPKPEKGQVPVPPSAIRPEKVRRTIALVVDDLTLSFASAYAVRKTLKKFVDEQMQDGDLVAIIRTGGGVGALQQFTTDRRQLYAAIEKVRFNLSGSAKIGSFAALNEPFSLGPTGDEAGQRSPEEIQRDQENDREGLFAVGTLGALRFVVRGMQELPGRKSIVLLSDGFKIFTRDENGQFESSRVLDGLKVLVDAANRAAVVIYTVDARGLEFTGLTAADNTSGRTFDQLEEALADRRNELFDTQDGLNYLAQSTGGFPIRNNNDLSGGIRKILDDQSYYLVGYEPETDTFDPKTRRFNEIKIKVTRPGTTVRYRSRFFGVSDEKLVQPPMTPAARLTHALTSPFAVNDISLRLNAIYYNTPKDGNMIRSLLHVAADDLKFTDLPDGKKEVTFEIVAISYGDNGIPVDQKSGKYTLTVTKAEHIRFLKNGFVHTFAFPVKKPGAYQLRIALRDSSSDKLGSANQFVEVPNLKKERLVLSGVVLENIEAAEWQKRDAGGPSSGSTSTLTDTSLRRFRRGTILNYGFSIYNSKVGPGGPNLSYQTRLYRDGKPVFEGKLQPVLAGRTGSTGVDFTGAISLGANMAPGDYVLQVVITDNLAKAKRNTAVQYAQFELVE